MPIEVTQPGGTDVNASEGPLRSGLIPKKVTYPLADSPNYKNQLKSASRTKTKGIISRFCVNQVRTRYEVVGGGVFASFARRG